MVFVNRGDFSRFLIMSVTMFTVNIKVCFNMCNEIPSLPVDLLLGIENKYLLHSSSVRLGMLPIFESKYLGLHLKVLYQSTYLLQC